jgi:hypothetical protein
MEDLEFVGVDPRVGIAHLERPAPHEHGPGLLDAVAHVVGPFKLGEVRIQPADVAIRVGEEAIERHGHPGDHDSQAKPPLS